MLGVLDFLRTFLVIPGLLADAAATPRLELPPPPSVPVRTIESSPPGARIGSTLRFDLFEPWLLGGVLTARNLTAGGWGFGGEIRLALPVRLYGQGRTGFGFAPVAAATSVGAFRDHMSFGGAVGFFENRRDRKVSPSALAFSFEAVRPFRMDGAGWGWSASALFMARGPWVAVAYTRIPGPQEASGALFLRLGLNFVEAFL